MVDPMNRKRQTQRAKNYRLPTFLVKRSRNDRRLVSDGNRSGSAVRRAANIMLLESNVRKFGPVTPYVHRSVRKDLTDSCMLATFPGGYMHHFSIHCSPIPPSFFLTLPVPS